uniref:MIP18429p n=1 Tax=Drosophila melanogaster TaxID=7227 RepID=D5SHR7_DROME|nr:MIP18429p [Drosophila melanogaster]
MHQTNWSRELVDFCFDHTKLPTANVRPALHARLFLIQFVNSPFDLLNEQRINGKMKTQNCNYNSNSANQHVFTTKTRATTTAKKKKKHPS